ncbi:MAG: hypothetical protein WDO74_30900 [Pseudomonadota bacterium]
MRTRQNAWRSRAGVGFCSALLLACGGAENRNKPAISSTAGSGNSAAGEDSAGSENSAGSGNGAGANPGGAGGVGTAGTAGTAGTVSVPNPVVGDCKGLGEIDKFENITPPGVKQVLNVLVDPVNSGTIYVGTGLQGIFKSTDCGATYSKLNTGAMADAIDSGLQWSMQIDPVNPDVLYAGSLYGSDLTLLKSTNAGIDWFSLFPPGSQVAKIVNNNFTQEVAIDPDPTRHTHLVVTFHDVCKDEFAPMCMGESNDSGTTWRLFKGPVKNWGEDARPHIIDDKAFLYVTFGDGAYWTGDNGANWEKVANGGNHQVYKTAAGIYYMGYQFHMLQSTDGHIWNKIENSPGGDGLVGDGERIFTAFRYPRDDKQPYLTTPENGDGKTWTKLASPEMAKSGAVQLKYDPGHQLLYSVNVDDGLWRVVTRAKSK